MFVCSCNALTDGAFARAIERHAAEIATAPSLRKAAALVFRSARAEGARPDAGACSSCIQTAGKMIQAAGFFKDEPALMPKMASPPKGRPPNGHPCDGCRCGALPPLALPR